MGEVKEPCASAPELNKACFFLSFCLYMPKSKSIFKGFKSSLGPLVAPGSPSAPLRSGIATPTTPYRDPTPTHDVVLNNLATACRITKDVAEALDKVPYIKAVTGVVAQIIKIHEVWNQTYISQIHSNP